MFLFSQPGSNSMAIDGKLASTTSWIPSLCMELKHTASLPLQPLCMCIDCAIPKHNLKAATWKSSHTSALWQVAQLIADWEVLDNIF